jgi:hypothetical protein
MGQDIISVCAGGAIWLHGHQMEQGTGKHITKTMKRRFSYGLNGVERIRDDGSGYSHDCTFLHDRRINWAVFPFWTRDSTMRFVRNYAQAQP